MCNLQTNPTKGWDEFLTNTQTYLIEVALLFLNLLRLEQIEHNPGKADAPALLHHLVSSVIFVDLYMQKLSSFIFSRSKES